VGFDRARYRIGAAEFADRGEAGATPSARGGLTFHPSKSPDERRNKSVRMSSTPLDVSARTETVTRDGVVVAGRGKASADLAPLADAIEAVLGERPYPGTLNLILHSPLLFDVQGIVLSRRQRYLWPVEIDGTPALAYRWRSCPLHVIEIVSARHLRSRLHLSDGNGVKLRFRRDLVAPLPALNKAAWTLLWGANGALYYSSDRFTRFVRRLGPLWRLSTQPIH
jgi:hypothetical protein